MALFGRLSHSSRCHFARAAAQVQMRSPGTLMAGAPRFLSQAPVQQEVKRLHVLEAIGAADLTELAKNPALDGPIQKLRLALEEQGTIISQDGSTPVPAVRNLALWGLLHGTPFIAFGFMDNAIMLLAGDFIDSTMGVPLGVSAMCACAVGNIIGDVFGLFAANPVEAAMVAGAARFRLPMPQLSAPQKLLPVTRMWKTMGCVIGVVAGCTLGMFPLVWPTEWRLWESRNTLFREEQTSSGSE